MASIELGELLTNEQTATLLGIKPNTLEVWRCKGKSPPFIKMGTHPSSPIRYQRSRVLAWIEANTHNSTIRTARSRTSGAYLFVVLLIRAPPSQKLEPPANPARFTMIGRTEIERTLKGLQHRYRLATTQKEPLWLSKLAIIELCGWIEVSTDDLVHRLAKKAVKEHGNLTHFHGQIVDRNFGFHYKKNFRTMLMAAVGLEGVETIESVVSAVSKAQLESEFGTLTISRNRLAHTYVKGVTAAIDAPSVTIARFNRIYPALKDYESAISAY